ncbi:hypothetical protein QYE76_062146 [Lolium multiflorum]|uniref:CCHC-type domain-containing protein n=1 Tax=Lolium multiflorum TaxID=4521 RepID=A0AAD8W5D3_LOLMU|nr:hypothetical protein QYE76_062146 [Lolium multiflorum]
MASSSSIAPINLGNSPSEKLTRKIFPLWCSMVLPAIRGAQLVGLLDSSDIEPPKELAPTAAEKTADDQAKPVPNPAYTAWLTRDQSVLSYLLQSLSLEILPHVHRIEIAAGVWQALEEMFAAQSEARVTNLLVALANTKKLQMTTAEFLTKMQGFADELVSAGHPLPDRQLVSYILAGIGGGYNSLVAALGVATTPITLSMLYSQLHAYDQLQEMLNASPSDEFETSANAASRHHRPQFFSNSGSGKPRDRGDRREECRDERRDGRRDERPSYQGRGGSRGPPGGGRGRGRGRRRTTPWVNATCQICNKEGHYAKNCWSRYEEDDGYGEKEINATYGVDTNWYQDSGATHHIIGELNNLSMRDTYKGYDKVNTSNGQEISFFRCKNPMASSSMSVTSQTMALGSPPTQLLTRENAIVWKDRIIPTLCSARVLHLVKGLDVVPPEEVEVDDIDGKKINVQNTEYVTWITRDQPVLSFTRWMMVEFSSRLLTWHTMEMTLHHVEVEDARVIVGAAIAMMTSMIMEDSIMGAVMVEDATLTTVTVTMNL